jgi:hypothetical protein
MSTDAEYLMQLPVTCDSLSPKEDSRLLNNDFKVQKNYCYLTAMVFWETEERKKKQREQARSQRQDKTFQGLKRRSQMTAREPEKQ